MGKGKPKKCCYPNCTSCVYKDCIYNDLETNDVKEQMILDKEIQHDRLSDEAKKRYEWQKKYFQSEKGKETLKRYNQSTKGKERQKRYDQSEKGKERTRRRTQKRIANGKNAESCRAYYQRKKAEKLRLLQIEGSVCL